MQQPTFASTLGPAAGAAGSLQGLVYRFQCFVKLPLPAPQPDENPNRDNGPLDALLRHVLQQRLCDVPIASADATVEKGVEADGVRGAPAIEHPVKGLKRRLQVAPHAMPMDDRGVRR